MERLKDIKKPIIIISISGFLLSLQMGFTTFIDSMYISKSLSKYFDNADNFVGYFFALGAILLIIGLTLTPRLLRKFGNTKITILLSILLPISLLLVAYNPNIFILLFSFLLVSISSNMLYTTNSIFVSSFSKEANTGFIFGVYFAILSLGFMLSPAISGYVVESYGLSFSYLAAAICSIPISILTWFTFKNFKDKNYEDVPVLPTKELKKTSPDLMPVFWSHFVLQSFYAIMTIYVPIYFLTTIGLKYTDFGLLLTIALSTFVILPSFLGYLADKYIGEKEMIIMGLILMGLSLVLISVLSKNPQPLYVWGIILFISRIGATMVESMTDVFFIKKIEHQHPSFISFYRKSRPLAFLTVPAISALMLSVNLINISELILISGLLITISTFFPFKLIDTK